MAFKVGIEAVATYIPEDRIDFTTRSKDWHLTPEFMETKIGVQRLSRKKSSEKASDLAVRAMQRLQKSKNVDLNSIEMICVVTQNPDQKIPHVSAKLQAKLGLPMTCAAFDISHGCAGYVYGLSIATAFMQNQGIKKALLFTSDPYSEVVDPNDRNTALLFGDAATVTLLSDKPILSMGKSSFLTAGQRWESLNSSSGQLAMDGLDVFNFAATNIPQEIQKVLEMNKISKDQIGSFLIHSGSRAIVEAICERAGLPSEKVPFGIENFGNTVSSSLPILLANQWEFFMKEKRPLLLSGFGVGLSSATTLLSFAPALGTVRL